MAGGGGGGRSRGGANELMILRGGSRKRKNRELEGKEEGLLGGPGKGVKVALSPFEKTEESHIIFLSAQ